MQVPPQYAIFPQINATLNATSAVLLLLGRYFIGRGRVAAHRVFMIAAFATSSVFLISYLAYHYTLYYYAHSASRHFQGQGWPRSVYFTILISHTILAILIVPMILVTLRRAVRERFDRHRAIARWTFPLWLYVSVTGVIVYFMLYHWFAA
jgi:putative membrane protein